MTVKLLTEHHLEFLSLTGDCTDSSESTLVKMPHCWKSHVTAQIILIRQYPLLFSLNSTQIFYSYKALISLEDVLYSFWAMSLLTSMEK